jgi:hypothetical protein
MHAHFDGFVWEEPRMPRFIDTNPILEVGDHNQRDLLFGEEFFFLSFNLVSMCFFLTLVSLSSCRKDANFVNYLQTLGEEMGMRSTLNIDDVVVHEESSQTVVGRKEERSKGKHDCDTEPMSPPRKKGHSSTKDVGPPYVVECFVEDVSASPHKPFLIKV